MGIDHPPHGCGHRWPGADMSADDAPHDEAGPHVGGEQQQQCEADRRTTTDKAKNRTDQHPVQRMEAGRPHTGIEGGGRKVSGKDEGVEGIVGQCVPDQRLDRGEHDIGHGPRR